jgi:hypothetical protein
MNNQPQIQKLTKQQKIETLRQVHQFLSTFDRVPGILAQQWAQVLQAVALVCDNITLYDVDEVPAAPAEEVK